VLPPESIIINLEPVIAGSLWLDQEYLSVLRRFPVLDYSSRNQKALHSLGIEHAGLLEIGYSPILKRIPQRCKDIDVLFYGYINDRRGAILQAIAARGLRVTAVHDMYGAERDAIIGRAKLVVNIHHQADNPFEIIRVSYLLANAIPVVSEGRPDDPDGQVFAGGVCFASVADLPSRCHQFILDDAARNELGRRGFESISSRPQSALLRRCFSGWSGPRV
jgi:hypothetical protein